MTLLTMTADQVANTRFLANLCQARSCYPIEIKGLEVSTKFDRGLSSESRIIYRNTINFFIEHYLGGAYITKLILEEL